MFLLVLAYLGGVLTLLSPCILPVLPFVFARADRPFARSGLPMLLGMAVTFAAVATLVSVTFASSSQSTMPVPLETCDRIHKDIWIIPNTFEMSSSERFVAKTVWKRWNSEYGL